MNYIKYKARFECTRDLELFFAAIQAFVDEWHVEPLILKDGQSPHSIRHTDPDRSVTFTVSDELTLPMMRWILTKLVDLHVAAQSLQRFEDYTGERTPYYEVVTQEPSQVVWHLVRHSLDYMYNYPTVDVDRYREALIEFTVPNSLKTGKRLRSEDTHVDRVLKFYFDERSTNAKLDKAAKKSHLKIV